MCVLCANDIHHCDSIDINSFDDCSTFCTSIQSTHPSLRNRGGRLVMLTKLLIIMIQIFTAVGIFSNVSNNFKISQVYANQNEHEISQIDNNSFQQWSNSHSHFLTISFNTFCTFSGRWSMVPFLLIFRLIIFFARQ